MMGAFLQKDAAQSKRDLEYVYDLFPRLKEREKQLAGTSPAASSRCLRWAVRLCSTRSC